MAYNQQATATYKIQLIASELALEKGDNLVHFMDEIGSARFVILLLSDDYFESPYCLHEMLEIHRNQNAEERIFPLAIKYDDAINRSTPTSILKTWESDDFCHNRLVELQISNDKDIKARLLKADDALIKPLRDHVMETQDNESVLQSVTQAADDVFHKEAEELTNTLIAEVTRLLSRMTKDDCFSLEDQLKKGFDSEEKIATHLLQQEPEKMMSIMQLWVAARDDEIDDLSEWRRFFRSVEAICGWLLLKSVDESWWVHNKIRLNSSDKKNDQVSVNINTPAYAEVIVGRSVMEAAQYRLNDQHHAFPARFDNVWSDFSSSGDERLPIKDEFVIDANPKAKAEELLIPMLYDLKRKPKEITRDTSRQLQELITEIQARPKQVYYLVSHRYLQKLREEQVNGRSILDQINEAVTGKLILISYDNCDDQDPLNACQQDKLLLTKMADILRMNKVKLNK